MSELVSKLNAEEKERFDNALKSLVASVDNEPCLSTRITLLRAQVAHDNIVEVRVSRLPTSAEWQALREFFETITKVRFYADPAPDDAR